MKKHPAKWYRKTSLAILAAGITIMLCGMVINSKILLIPSILLMAFSVIYNVSYYRCPYCGKYLDRSTGDYCPYCSKDINEVDD